MKYGSPEYNEQQARFQANVAHNRRAGERHAARAALEPAQQIAIVEPEARTERARPVKRRTAARRK